MSPANEPSVSLRGAVDLSGLAAPQAPAPGQPGGAPAAGGYSIDVTDANFESVVAGSAEHVVLAVLWIPTDQVCATLASDLESLAEEAQGRFLVARVDVNAYPQIAQAFQPRGVPHVSAIIGGRPLPLFEGGGDKEQIRAVLSQVLEQAAQMGIAGTVERQGAPDAPEEQAPAAAPEPPLPPRLAQAQEALEAGDLAAAHEAYRLASREDPSDRRGQVGLATVGMLQRTENVTFADAIAQADGAPEDVRAQLLAADCELLSGKEGGALDRLLTLLPTLSGDEKEAVRTRLVDYFLILGDDNPLVAPARRRLTAALY